MLGSSAMAASVAGSSAISPLTCWPFGKSAGSSKAYSGGLVPGDQGGLGSSGEKGSLMVNGSLSTAAGSTEESSVEVVMVLFVSGRGRRGSVVGGRVQGNQGACAFCCKSSGNTSCDDRGVSKR